MSINENTRVKIPAILHLCKLGYEYVSLANAKRDENTNIFTDIFNESILRINPELGDFVRGRISAFEPRESARQVEGLFESFLSESIGG